MKRDRVCLSVCLSARELTIALKTNNVNPLRRVKKRHVSWFFTRGFLFSRVRRAFPADEEDIDVEEEDVSMYSYKFSQPDPAIDTSRVEEIPAKEPKFHAVPLKSVLKKRGSGSGPGTPQNTPTQENRPLTLRQELHASFKLVWTFYLNRAVSSLSPPFAFIYIDARVYSFDAQAFEKKTRLFFSPQFTRNHLFIAKIMFAVDIVKIFKT